MNIFYTEKEQIIHRRKKGAFCSGMHPGGGYVAWPDGSSTYTAEKTTSRKKERSRGYFKKGFIAWPEKE